MTNMRHYAMGLEAHDIIQRLAQNAQMIGQHSQMKNRELLSIMQGNFDRAHIMLEKIVDEQEKERENK